jgi:hypothetical protein
MGYRSEVVLVVGKELMPAFMAVTANPNALSFCFSETDTLIQDYEEEGAILFYWSWIKWYPGYCAVDDIQNFLSQVENGAFDETVPEAWEHYRFVRTGEEVDDNETQGCGFGDVCISREIQW